MQKKQISKTMSYRLGMVFIGFAMILPVFILVVPLLKLSATKQAMLIGFFTIGGPEVFLIIGAVLAGKEGIETIKGKLKLFFKTKTITPVSQKQYYIGIALFVLGAFITLVMAYLPYLAMISLTKKEIFYLTVSGDILFLIGFFVAGDQFWAKWKKLFVWEAE